MSTDRKNKLLFPFRPSVQQLNAYRFCVVLATLVSWMTLLIIIRFVTVKFKITKKKLVPGKNIIYAIAVLICFTVVARKYQNLYIHSVKLSGDVNRRIFLAWRHNLS